MKVLCRLPLLASELFTGCFQRPKTEQKKSARSADAFRVSCTIIGPHSGSLAKAYGSREDLGVAFYYLTSSLTSLLGAVLSALSGRHNCGRKMRFPTRLTGPVTAPRSRVLLSTSSMTFPPRLLPLVRPATRQTRVAKARCLARSTRSDLPVRSPGGCRTGVWSGWTRTQTRRSPHLCLALNLRKCYVLAALACRFLHRFA